MTAIWDTLGSVSYKLSENFEPKKADKLKMIITKIYECIKQEPEYQKLTEWYTKANLLVAMKEVIDEKQWDKLTCDLVHQIITVLHDFDHKDLPFKGKSRFGHHTEMVLTQRKNKKIMKGLENMYYNSWWNGDFEE